MGNDPETKQDDDVSAPDSFIAQMEAREEERRAGQMALPIWDETKRATPLAFVESALFSAAPLRTRQYLEDVQIDSSDDHSVTYTGVRLTQYDADVWRGIMHLARGTEDDQLVHFSSRQLLRLIGRDTGGNQRRQLLRALKRLQATSVSIFDKRARQRYFGSLLPVGAEREITERDSEFAVQIPRALVRFFDDGVRQLDWQPRKKLQKKPLALWLQVFYSDRREAPVVHVEELQRLSGSDVKGLRFFRRALRTALDELQEADVLYAWHIDAHDRVHVEMMDTAKLALRRTQREARAEEQTSLALGFVLSAETRKAFAEHHSAEHFEQCLADWNSWLDKSGRRETTKNPDRAFLGFAQKWKVPA